MTDPTPEPPNAHGWTVQRNPHGRLVPDYGPAWVALASQDGWGPDPLPRAERDLCRVIEDAARLPVVEAERAKAEKHADRLGNKIDVLKRERDEAVARADALAAKLDEARRLAAECGCPDLEGTNVRIEPEDPGCEWCALLALLGDGTDG